MRMTQVGYVSDITKKMGQSANGAWTMTRFRFSVLEYRKQDGENVIRKYWISTFNNLDVKEGPAMLNIDIVNRKTGKKNDNGNDIYELALDCTAFQSLETRNPMEQQHEEQFEEDNIPF